MKQHLLVLIICLIGLCGCSDGSNNNDNTSIVDNGFEMISPAIKDSLIALENSGLLSISLSKVAVLEKEDNSMLEWILNNGQTKDFEELLYNHPDASFKALGVKGLIRNNDTDLFKHLKFSIDQDDNIQYNLTCQKLGGYFLYQLHYSVSDSTSVYFSKDELEELKEILAIRKLGCT